MPTDFAPISPTWLGGAPQARNPNAPGPQLSPEERQRQEEERRKKEAATQDANTLNAAEAANRRYRRRSILFGSRAADLLSLSDPNFGAKPPVRPEDLMHGSPSDQSGGARPSSGGGGGGFTASYAPRPQGGINAHVPKPGETSAQDNFERARARGEITPDKIKQAQAFGDAHGYDFDPSSGYTKKPGFAQGTPKGGVPLKHIEGMPFMVGERGPELAEIKGGKLHVVPNHKLDELGLGPMPMMGFADGTGDIPPDVLDRAAMFPTQTIPDASLPPEEWKPAPAPIGKYGIPGKSAAASGIAYGQRENAFIPAPPKASAPVPDYEPGVTPAPTSSTMTGTPRATPGFATSHFLSPPPGMRRTDFRRFMQSPQGTEFMLNQKARAQQDTQHNDFVAGLHQQDYERRKADDKQEKQERADAEQRGLDGVVDLLHSQGHLSDDVLATYKAAKDPKTRAAIGRHLVDIGGQAAHWKQHSDAETKMEEEKAKRRSVTGTGTITDAEGKFYIPTVKRADGSEDIAGGAYPIKGEPQQLNADQLKWLKDNGYEVTQRIGGTTVKSHPNKDKPEPSHRPVWDTNKKKVVHYPVGYGLPEGLEELPNGPAAKSTYLARLAKPK